MLSLMRKHATSWLIKILLGAIVVRPYGFDPNVPMAYGHPDTAFDREYLFIDTAGIDDVGSLGEQRVEKTQQVFDRTDVGVDAENVDHLASHLRFDSTHNESSLREAPNYLFSDFFPPPRRRPGRRCRPARPSPRRRR